MTTTEPSTVCYTAKLPLSWLVEPATNESALVRLRQTNISLLRALAGIEAVTEHEHDSDSQLMKTLERLESKIDIALSLLARLGNRLRVTSVKPVFAEFRCVTEMLDRNEEFLEWMTRTVFRYHRRTLHARRQQ